MKTSRMTLAGTLVAALVVVACSDPRSPAAALAPSLTTSAPQSTTYSGQATVVQATVLGQSVRLVNAGPLPPEGGAAEDNLLAATVPGLLSAEVLHAATIAGGSHSRSEASVANVTVTAGGNTISAGFLMARAEARCTDGTASASGSSEIVLLTINSQTVVVSGDPNQTIALPNGSVVINEQRSDGAGDITVNALHVVVNGIADVVVSSAHADIECPTAPPPPPPACPGFVTGGGWIIGTPSGEKGNFGVAGGIKNGGLWGHLTYQDHGPNGPRVRGTGVTGYTVTAETSRRIEGTADIDGQPGTYQVDVTDAGEPGRNDQFALKLSTGYAASGSLQGGNIQIHNCQ